MRNISLRKLSVGAMLVGTSLAGAVSLASPASANPRSFNRANVTLSGGDARALSLCVNVARSYARVGRSVPAIQSNRCGGATAEGGEVSLNNVTVLVDQVGGGYRSNNAAAVTLSGGDATAIAACINYSQGRATAIQRNQCAGAKAIGGDVTVKNTDIVISQAA
jgi:hypothetical protein